MAYGTTHSQSGTFKGPAYASKNTIQYDNALFFGKRAPLDADYTSNLKLGGLLGFYFEACIIAALHTLSGKRGKPTLSGQQVNAVKVAMQGTSKGLSELKNRIERAATQVAIEWDSYLTDGGTEERNYNVSQQKGAAELGDIVIKDLTKRVQKKPIVFEAKWQTDPQSDSMIRWFELQDSKLFGSKTFFNFINKKEHARYWNHIYDKKTWTDLITQNALLHFLNKELGLTSAFEQFQYLFHKAEVKNTFKKKYETKYVIVGTKVTFSIANVEDLLSQMYEVGNQIGEAKAFDYFNKETKEVKSVMNRGVLFTKDNETVATFGSVKYTYALNEYGSNSNQNNNAFKFAMYVKRGIIDNS